MKKFLSVFLTMLMVFGMFTVAIIPSFAATGSGTKSDPYVIHSYDGLKNTLIKSETLYIRLSDNLSSTEVNAITVVGEKYLDLNGFEINKKLDIHGTYYMFYVKGKLEIDDSSATGKSYEGKGKIMFTNKIWTPSSSDTYTSEFIIQRNVFKVENGATLVLNRGKIISGSNEKKWITDGRAMGNSSKVFNGNAYVQINGTAVTVNKGGKFIMNGGYVEGRGFEKFGLETNTATRLSAIYAPSGSLEINSGRVVGKGGANVLTMNSSSTVIRGGSFETEKVDNVWVARAQYKIAGIKTYRNMVANCGYGYTNIYPSAFKQGLEEQSINISQSGKDIINKSAVWSVPSSIANSEKNITVSPIDRRVTSFLSQSGERFLNLNYTYGNDYYIRPEMSYYFPTDSEMNYARIRVNIECDERLIASKYYENATKINVASLYNYQVGKVYKVSGYIDQLWGNGDYSLSYTINPITVSVIENKVNSIGISYTNSNFTGNLLKSGSSYNFDNLKLKSTNSGVALSYSSIKAGNKAVSSSEAIENNTEYTVVLCVKANSGYSISTATYISILGSTYYVSSHRGNVGYITIKLKSECTHPSSAKSQEYDNNAHYIECSICGEVFNRTAHTFDAGVINGEETIFSCTKCAYLYTTENGREGLSNICIESEQHAVGDTIPEIKYVFSAHKDKYTITYQWYKESVEDKNKVNPGEKFENTDYFLQINSVVTDSEKYFFEEDAGVASYFYQTIISNNSTETTITSVMKITPLLTGTGTITLPDVPAINSSLYEAIKKISIKLVADNKDKLDESFTLWVTEEEKDKAQITYAVDYEASTKTFSIDTTIFKNDITDVKIKPNVTYSIIIFGLVGTAFKDVKIIGGKGSSKAEFDDNFLGVKGFFGFWDFYTDTEIKNAYIPKATFKAGQKAPQIIGSDSDNYTLTYSYSGLNEGGIIPCDKNVKVKITLSAKKDCSFATKENLHIYLGDDSCSITSSEKTKAVAEYTIKLSGHSLTKQTTKNATCTTSGKTTATCKNCNKKITVSTTKALGHSYEKVTIKATVSANGATMKKCKTCSKETSKATTYKISSIKLSKTDYTYTGKTQKPIVTIKDSKGNKLKDGTDYKVSYSSSSSISTGRYTVTITFKGKYSGEKVLSYTISPKAPTDLKLSSQSKKTVKITYKKAIGASGYEIYYATSKSGNYKKLKELTGTSYTYKKMSSSKTYYFKVRAYKTVNGEKIYGSFNTSKSIKIK